MNIEQILNSLDEMLDSSWSLPLSGGRCVVDADRVRDMIDDIRINLPAELKQAQGVVDERANILEKAQKEAEAIVRKAEVRARRLVEEDEILKEVQRQASELQATSLSQAKEMRQAAYSFSDNSLRETEEVMCTALNQLRDTRKALRINIQKSNSSSRAVGTTAKLPEPEEK